MSEPTVKIRHISDYKPQSENARKHTPRNLGMIVDAIHEIGAARSGVVNEDNEFMAGSGTYEAMVEAGIEQVVEIETDGHQWVVVKRPGLDDRQQQRLAIYDNRSTELAFWDHEVLSQMIEMDEEILSGLFYEDEIQGIVDLANGSAPSLDDLAGEYGDPNDEDLWPEIHLKVPPETNERYMSLMRLAPGQTDAEKFTALMNAVDEIRL